jgi:uncharacterized membrane protein (UPF0182 family)
MDLIGQGRGRHSWVWIIAVVAVVLLIGSRYLAGTWIDYQWWREMHQLDTWFNLILYGTVPVLLVFALLCVLFWTALRLGLRRPVETPLFGIIKRGLVIKLAMLALAIVAFLVANATVDNWTVVRFLGGMRLAPSPNEYLDPIFHQPLHFYFFTLPFAHMLLTLVVTATIITLLTYAVAVNAERLANQRQFMPSAASFEFDDIHWRGLLDSLFVRLGVALLLLGMAVKIYFDRFGLLQDDHGQYLVGVDWLGDHIVLPLMWVLCLTFALGAALVLAKRIKIALAVVIVMLAVRFIVPGVISSVYVHPNELALEKPYIQDHINATRAAFGLSTNVKETSVPAEAEIPLEYAPHKALLDNVRLWDWRAFHDTISQIQPLRPYIYQDTDVDRYIIDGQIRQVLISPRELDIKQLGSAANRWINPHLIYTHGYGVVMAEANRITSDGLPVLLIKDAPPVSSSPSLQLKQPDLYYSEIAHEPVFVDTSQREFDYPSGGDSVETVYKGSGGFIVGSPLTRLAAAIEYGDMNLLLTEYLHSNSRMMIHRQIVDRLHKLAGFLTWDNDPYIVLTESGHLAWIVDGYMTSDANPYSRAVDLNDQSLNYMRNSVKATVDAYTGEVHLYTFDPNDVLLRAYSRLFPTLFEPVSKMPADLRKHVRYPETLFQTQAEIYRAFHMRDPEAFYNRADYWDLAKTSNRSDQGPSYVSPTFVVAALPGSDKPEFLLITTFTPANKDNLIGVMYARCDGDHLGDLVFSQLSKQNIVYGPMQIDARINQDQTISKDLSLWNQQGSTVLRGQTLVLPIDNSFLYVEPLYIQAQQASMPQLKKVAIAMGNRLAYADTYEQALQDLIAQTNAGVTRSEAATPTNAAAPPPVAPVSAGTNQPQSSQMQSSQPQSNGQAEQKLRDVQTHLQRYRELSAQGKWAEAGKELEQIQQLVNNR